MYRYCLLLLFVLLNMTAFAQDNYIFEAKKRDYIFINYPLKDGPLYRIGDTVRKGFYTGGNGFLSSWIPGGLSGKQPPYYEITGVVKALHKNHPEYIGHYADSLAVEIFSIEHVAGNDRKWQNSFEHAGKTIEINETWWMPASGVVNTTGFYAIRKNTDNFNIGDTVQNEYYVGPGLLADALGVGQGRGYIIRAVVKDISVSEPGGLQLEILSVRYSHRYTRRASQDINNLEYNGNKLQPGQLIWTDCYDWQKHFQYIKRVRFSAEK